jgi:hypothetical protein
MRRFLLLAALLVAFGATASADSSSIVISSGVIVVHNWTPKTIYITIMGVWGKPRVDKFPINGYESRYFDSGCCWVAGTSYPMWALRPEHTPATLTGSFVPHLCNRDGIPYGYASIGVGWQIEEVAKTECYTGPYHALKL